MSDQPLNNTAMAKDTVLYMVAKAIEGIVGIVTLTFYTHLLIDEAYGQYTILNTTSQIGAMLCIQWLLQSVMRYVNDYEIQQNQKAFYSTAFFSWLRVNVFIAGGFVLLVLFSSLFLGDAPYIGVFLAQYPPRLLYLMAGVFVSYNTAQLLIALLAAKRRVKLNLLLSVGGILGKLLLLILLVQLFGSRIEWIFVSNMVFDAVTALVAVLRLGILGQISRKAQSKETFRQFSSYGVPLIGNLATTTVLNNSDKYIISGYLGEAATGQYSPNYTMISSSFTMISTAIMRGSYPMILRAHSEGKKELTENLISQAVRNYLLLAVPAVAGVGVIGKTIALLFAESYRSAYQVMFWVALGMLFLGLTEYSNKIWELSANTKIIFRNSLIGGTVNIMLNLLFMKQVGYIMAAYSTFAGFFVYFLLSKLGSRKYIQWHIGMKSYAAIFGSAGVMSVVLMLMQQLMGISRWMLFADIAAGVLVYGCCLLISGEIKEETQWILKYIKMKWNGKTHS